MMTDIHPGLMAQLTEMHTKLDQLFGLLTGPREDRACYTVEEIADKLKRSSYTVREWCRQGRINATKRVERRGGAELWSISAAELNRYRNEGLLPPDPGRNA
jgi:predicted site-specific integrase-resolvase